MPKKRSKGVTILSAWLMLSAAIGILGTISSGSAIPSLMKSLNLAWLILALLCGIGLFLLKEWARKAAITLYAFSVALGTFNLFIMGHIQWEQIAPDILPAQKTMVCILSAGIYLVWFIAIAFFLTRPKVKEQFK